MSVHRAAEDYLEAMLMMRERHGYIRSIDVAEHLGVTKPSVTYATKQLKQNGFITMDRDGLITLTESGMEIADRIYTRHKTLTEFFMRIGVDEKTAREDACKVEHDVSEKTFAAICAHVARQESMYHRTPAHRLIAMRGRFFVYFPGLKLSLSRTLRLKTRWSARQSRESMQK